MAFSWQCVVEYFSDLKMSKQIPFKVIPNQKKRAAKSSQLSQLYTLFPSLVCQNQSCTKLAWLRQVGRVSLLVRVACPNFPSSEGSKIYGDESTIFLLDKSEAKIFEAVEGSDTVVSMLTKVDMILTEIEKNNPKLGVSGTSDVTSSLSVQILSELETAGWDNVTNISPDLSSATLSCVDIDTQVTHTMTIHFPASYPTTSPLQVTHNLPDCWEPPTTTSLLQMYSCWEKAVSMYSLSWSALRELDRLCWVLDPDMPGPQHLYRRMVLGPSVSLHIVVDPSAPLALPSVRFLGADQRISPLRQSLAENVDLWDEEDPLLTNLERVLGVEFPSRTDSAKEDWSVECGICYSYRLGDQLPTKTCDDSRCCQPFHLTCLYEWLVNLPGARTTLSLVHGECPYCSKPMQCPRPSE